jgi:hypothetical protein
MSYIFLLVFYLSIFLEFIIIIIIIITRLVRGLGMGKKIHRWSIRPPPEMVQYFEEHQDLFDGMKSNMISAMWNEFKMSQRTEVEKRLKLIESERLSLQAKLNDFMARERLTFQIETGKERATSKFDTVVVEFQKTAKRNWKIAKSFRNLHGKQRTKEENFHELMEVPVARLRKELKLSNGLSDDLLLESALKGILLQTLQEKGVEPG